MVSSDHLCRPRRRQQISKTASRADHQRLGVHVLRRAAGQNDWKMSGFLITPLTGRSTLISLSNSRLPKRKLLIFYYTQKRFGLYQYKTGSNGPFIDIEPLEEGLNPKYTFEKFVVGSCNQFAHAAAKAAAETPGTTYNPLFIYGGVGLGKTHLMHAIGHAIKARSPHMRVSYIIDRFMNELINAIVLIKHPAFRTQIPFDRRAADGRRSVHGWQGTHTRRVFPHFQHAPQRPKTDHRFERLPAERDPDFRGTPALAF